jgi:catechol 2,3-dioxygenase-like lactoylglutathione lyase family enzyme
VTLGLIPTAVSSHSWGWGSTTVFLDESPRQWLQIMIKGLHHNAYRCRDSEATRKFYEDFLLLPLQCAFEIKQTKTGRDSRVLHSFYGMADGSFLAFFEEPDEPFEFRQQRDFDLHIALEVESDYLLKMLEKGRSLGMKVRGISDHDFIHSIYFRDPNGYVIELAAKTDSHDANFDSTAAHTALQNWQQSKPQ